MERRVHKRQALNPRLSGAIPGSGNVKAYNFYCIRLLINMDICEASPYLKLSMRRSAQNLLQC